jgi:transketolase
MRKRWLSTLHTMAVRNPRIVFVGSDLTADPAMKKFQSDVPDRFFMEGVSEAYIVGMAAGLAMSGFIPYVNTIATFLTRRCFEQVSIDLGLANANVRLISGGGGLVYAPLGPTHLAIDDVALMRAIPNMTIVVPCDADEIERAMLASETHEGPIYLRVAKGGEEVVSREEAGFRIGEAIVLRQPGDVLFVASGVLVKVALRAAEALATGGISAGVINVHTIKPLDEERLLENIARSRVVITLEEHLVSGGLGSAVAELFAEHGCGDKRRFKRLGLPDEFPHEYGSQDSLLATAGLDVESIVGTARSLHMRE